MSWSERQALKRFGEVVPTLTSRLLYWILYMALMFWVGASSLLTYRSGIGPAIQFLSFLVTPTIPPLAQFAYEATMKRRFRHLLQDETLSAIRTSAQDKTGVHLAHEMWLRDSDAYFVIPVTMLFGNAIVVSRKALELLKAGPERAEVVFADRLFRLKASDARFRSVLTTLVWAGTYLTATVLISWAGLGFLMYVPTTFLLLVGVPSLAGAAILGLFAIMPLVWSDNPGKANVREIYGVFAAAAENELLIGRTLTPDETNAVLDRARRDEMSRRAERRSIISLLSAALAIVVVLWAMYSFHLPYYWYVLSNLILLGVPAGALFVVITVLYIWDRRCTRQNWGFTSETQEPIWMD